MLFHLARLPGFAQANRSAKRRDDLSAVSVQSGPPLGEPGSKLSLPYALLVPNAVKMHSMGSQHHLLHEPLEIVSFQTWEQFGNSTPVNEGQLRLTRAAQGQEEPTK